MKSFWLSSLHQSPECPNVSQKTFWSIIFLDIQTHPPLLPITTCFISSRKFSVKSFSIVKTLFMVILLISFLFWNIDLPIFQTMLFIMFHLDIETLNDRIQRFGNFHLGLCEDSILLEIYWQIEPWIFFRITILIVRRIQNMLDLFELSHRANTSLTATAGFMSFTKVAIEGFLLLMAISGDNCPFVALQLTSDSLKSQEVSFIMESSRFSKQGFLITSN